MSSRAIIAMLSFFLAAGCTQVKDLFTPAKPPPPQPPAAQPERREPPARLSPQVTSAQEQRLLDEATSKIQGAERTLRFINEQAALSRKDFPRAINLAQKAQILLDELSPAQR